MRLGFSALITGAALAVSSLAHAASAPKAATVKPTPSPTQSTPTASTADGLAQLTAILGYCSQVDRPSAGEYIRALAHILSGNALSNQAGGSYVAGIRSIDQQLGSLPVSTVTSACKNFLAGK